MNFQKYHYYDAPEGEDLTGKMIATNRFALIGALSWAVTDILMLSKPKGYLPTIARMGYFALPAAGMASAFTMTTYAATRIRHKDDHLNYALGAIAAGGVCGAWRKSVGKGLALCGVFAVAAVIKKMSVMEGWEFFPEIKQHRQGEQILTNLTGTRAKSGLLSFSSIGHIAKLKGFYQLFSFEC
jgi:NADH dehydrogenase (ubiquinone) 1 alpha subcomplex subunit 11